jgi:hypothetical protein
MTFNNIPNLMPISEPQIILRGSDKPDSFDRYSVAFSSLLQENGEYFLYYTGAIDKYWSYASIGIAKSKDLSKFKKKKNPIIEDQEKSGFSHETVTPAATRVGSRYYLIFAGRKHRFNRRVLGIAYSDDPSGPFKIIGTLYKPSMDWEGYSIDNGPTIIKLEENELMVFYSNCAPSIKSLLFRKPFIRKIGLLKVKIRGTKKDSIEVFPSKTPVPLNGSIGSWHESVFCPGYIYDQDSNKSYLFFSSSTYSKRPITQYIGYALIDLPYMMHHIGEPFQLLSAEDLQPFFDKKNLGFDSPCPIKSPHDEKIILFYSVLDRNANRWSIFKSTFKVY